MQDWKGAWLGDDNSLSQISYYKGEGVKYGNIAYIATAEVIASGSPIPPSDMSNWNIIVSGAMGTSGSSGTSGINGTSGTSGINGTSGSSGTSGTSGLTGATGSGVPSGGTTGQVLSKIDETNYNTQWIDASGGGGLSGTNYVFVQANGTATENATELQAAYTTAEGMSPTSTNRIIIVAAPGYYNFGSTTFTMDTEYIDLVSLDGNRSIIFNSSNGAGTISITANDVFVKGVDVSLSNKPFTIASNLNLLKIENCKGGNFSFGISTDFTNFIVNGTFINCTGGDYSFGSGFTAAASGIFIDCVGGKAAFGGEPPLGLVNATGIFINCTSGINGFGGGYGSVASGTFTNCTGGHNSFSKDGSITGKLYYCRLTSGTFQTVSDAGITRYCIDGSDTANNQG